MILLSIDVGKKGAVAFYDIDKAKFTDKFRLPFVSMLGVYHQMRVQIPKCDGVLIGEAFGQRQVVKAHSKYYGIIELVAEQNDVPVIYVSDRTARAVVLGKGNGNRKEKVREFFNEEDPDIADAMLFAKWYEKAR